MAKEFPYISVVTPTLNAGAVLSAELKSIREQDYPQDKVEIIIADGGSKDNTLEIARKYNAVIVKNPLKTGEAGKAVGVKASKGDFIALIDSDNILPQKDWLTRMLEPFEDEEIVASEPWEYTYRKEGGFIERYSALIGVNDPMVLFFGNYDRLNHLTGKWTGITLEEEDKGEWLKVTLANHKPVPTIGANGTIFKTPFLKNSLINQEYLFDIDIIASEVRKRNYLKIAKVKIGIIHTFCEASIIKFKRKQKRRVSDYLYHQSQNHRNISWSSDKRGKVAIIKFTIYSALLIPPLLDSARGYGKIKDKAWCFHPLACLITLWEYSLGTLKGLLSTKELPRSAWRQ